MAELLQIDSLSAGYGEAVVLHDVSLSLAEGHTLALLGRNGTGKTTLINTLVGATRMHAGRIMLGAAALHRMPSHQRAAAGIGWVPQERNIFKSLTVHENLSAVQRPARPGARCAPWDPQRVYAMFPRLAERRTQRAGTLSGGEQQMLALARALAIPPKLIIADEMSLGLAPIVVESVFETIGEAAKRGVTIVLIEQFIHRALSLATGCVILMRGTVAWSGSADHAEQEILDRYLGESADATG